MGDSDQGSRVIHCNSDRIGFLNQAGSWGAWCDDNGYWRASLLFGESSTRSPIYYDYNDTGYYVDPNSTGLSLSSNGIVSSGTGVNGGFQNKTYTGGRNRIWSFGNADGYGISYFQGGPDYIGFHVSGTPTQAGSDFFVSSTGISQSSASSRAPIFYDSNNTAYYVDPASTSNLEKINLSSGIIGAGITDQFTLNGKSQPHYGFNLSPGGGVPIGISGYYGISLATQGAERFTINQNGDATALISSRAPIFYDLNDTGYYVDPTSTSVLGLAKFNKAVSATGGISTAVVIKQAGAAEISFGSYPASWTSAFQIQNNSNTDFIWMSPLDDGYSARFRTGGSGLDFYTDGANDTGTYSAFIGSGSVRAPIFYDLDDTAYYVDPNTTGTSVNVAGSIIAGGNITAYSDRRVKENIEPITNALNKVQQLNGVTFNRIDLSDKTKRYAGLIAQDIEKVLPEAVDDDVIKRVDYNATIGLLVEAIKELKTEVDSLKTQLAQKEH